MMALRYGTVPIVRRTGGLADVVKDYDPSSKTGNGFDFRFPNSREMLQAVERALEIYHQQPDDWQGLLTTAMQARDRHGDDFTWNTAANRYLTELYETGDQTETGP
jgi:starch synthase